MIGTRATIKSKAYEKQIKKINPGIKVISQACPLFVPLVEEGWVNRTETISIAKDYFKQLIKKDKNIDILILGCTHYPLLKQVIKKVLGKRLKLVDSAQQVVRDVALILKNKGLARNNPGSSGRYKFYVTDDPEGFSRQAVRFLGQGLLQVKKITNV